MKYLSYIPEKLEAEPTFYTPTVYPPETVEDTSEPPVRKASTPVNKPLSCYFCASKQTGVLLEVKSMGALICNSCVYQHLVGEE